MMKRWFASQNLLRLQQTLERRKGSILALCARGLFLTDVLNRVFDKDYMQRRLRV